MPTIVSPRESPVCVHGSGPSPSRARQSLNSCRPCSSPIATARSVWRQRAAPTRVRGRRAPIENGGKPDGRSGWTWGTTVATGTPSSSAASAGAGVRMSETATSGSKSRTNWPVTRAASTAAS